MFFAEKDGKRYTLMQQATTLEFDNFAIAFPSPNPISLFMNIAVREHNRAKELYSEYIDKNLQYNCTLTIDDEIMPKFLDYLEHVQTSVITAYSAVEALSNVAIPIDYKLEKTNNKGILEIWNKENIERWTATTEKIGKIVPKILKIESPNKLSFWNGFLELEKTRNNIIHQKQSVHKPGQIETNYLFGLVDISIFSYIKSAFDLITYFCQQDQTHTYFPILKDVPIKQIEVDNWDEFFKFDPYKFPSTESEESKKIR